MINCKFAPITAPNMSSMLLRALLLVAYMLMSMGGVSNEPRELGTMTEAHAIVSARDTLNPCDCREKRHSHHEDWYLVPFRYMFPLIADEVYDGALFWMNLSYTGKFQFLSFVSILGLVLHWFCFAIYIPMKVVSSFVWQYVHESQGTKVVPSEDNHARGHSRK
ncbi:Aste57867_21053 [Aphanomyces stellatus]|uniref:Aste57867_21053 protein n=1 Tax=Aphanomyces stellatus TaxID=120398 RepID=A0A485LGI2_9STRA|nr:hypothetical protein As57867_020985 [Aphanomyces stellatus]VFT97728.1 Aste57867_21053 [Aphanomyces stellatus]